MNQTPVAPLTPRPAATVILLREAERNVEVLAIRRHEKLAFMGGMWVFPGGALAAADMSAEALACIPERAQARCSEFHNLQGEPLSRIECFGLSVAAFRETFEETGVLLATTLEGRGCSDDLLNCLQAQRRPLAANAALFAQLLRVHDLLLEIDRLVYWAHWITPSNAPRRFDTRFFIAHAPPAQTAIIDTIEAIDYAWMTPRALLAAAEAGSMTVSQPTLYNLMELDASLHLHSSLRALLDAERTRTIAPVLPKVRRENGTLIVMPWDPEYRDMPGEAAPPDLTYPDHLRALPSRLIAK